MKFEDGQDLTYFWSAALPTGKVFRCPLAGWNKIETHMVVEFGGDRSRLMARIGARHCHGLRRPHRRARDGDQPHLAVGGNALSTLSRRVPLRGHQDRHRGRRDAPFMTAPFETRATPLAFNLKRDMTACSSFL